MMGVSQFHEFETREELAEALAAEVAGKLGTDLESGEFASIALSGGSTPKLFLNKLGERLSGNSEMIYFAMVDERFVPVTDEQSNERMIRQQLGLQDHPPSEFLSLYEDNLTPEELAIRAHGVLLNDDELPFDVVTLGMGLDGHTASFFPGGNRLGQAVDPEGSSFFEHIEAAGSNGPRVTMTLPPIVSANNLILHIEGAEKRAVFEKALEDGPADEMPIRHVLRHPDANLQVYWAP